MRPSVQSTHAHHAERQDPKADHEDACVAITPDAPRDQGECSGGDDQLKQNAGIGTGEQDVDHRLMSTIIGPPGLFLLVGRESSCRNENVTSEYHSGTMERLAGDTVEVDLRMGRVVRRLFSIGLAGAIAGVVVGGLGGRVVMRISAIAAGDRLQGALTDGGNRVGDITVGGTIGLVVFGGLFAGVLGGVVLASVDPWLPADRRLRGPVTGSLLLAFAGSVLISPDNFDFLILDPPSLNVAMFAALLVLFGIVAVPLADRIEARLDSQVDSATSPYALLPLVVIGALGMFPVYGSLLFRSQCECADSPVEVGLFAILTMIASVSAWVYQVRTGSRIPLAIRLFGVAAVIATAIFGALRLVDHIQRIV